MAEVAGLVIGAAGLIANWNACVQAFDVVASTRAYGLEYEIVNIKLEVERVRLLTWGETVGLMTAIQGENPQRSVDSRLDQEPRKSLVLSLFACIQHVFEDTATLQQKYGMRFTSAEEDEGDSNALVPTSSSAPVLAGIFKRAYTNLQKAGEQNDKSVSWRRKLKWGIGDKGKFLHLVSEIRSWNDSLVSLFPDAQQSTNNIIQSEITNSQDIRDLQLLQQASEDDHGNWSETASVRLEHLGATILTTERPLLEAQVLNLSLEDKTKPTEQEPVIVREEPKKPTPATVQEAFQISEDFIFSKEKGRLKCGMLILEEPVYFKALSDWRGHADLPDSPVLETHNKGLIRLNHACFTLYHQRRYIQAEIYQQRKQPTEEDFLYVDAEADAKYENIHVGTVTLEGYALECWEYEQLFGKAKRFKRVEVNSKPGPQIPLQRLLWKIRELREAPRMLGLNRIIDHDDICDLINEQPSAVNAYDYSQQISQILRNLNRKDLYVNFTDDASINSALYGDEPPGEMPRYLFNFLCQIVLATELRRRLDVTTYFSTAEYTVQVLSSLIIAEQWVKNVKIMKLDKKAEMLKTYQEASAKYNTDYIIDTQAEKWMEEGDKALEHNEINRAIALYTKAIERRPHSKDYWLRRAIAYSKIPNWTEVQLDADTAFKRDPMDPTHFLWMGKAWFELGKYVESLFCYEWAIELSKNGGTQEMKDGLEKVKAKQAEIKEALIKKDLAMSEMVRQKLELDANWLLENAELQYRSLAHETQIEGLLRFAATLKWPYLNELRDYAEDLYSDVLTGKTNVDALTWDWLFGLSLPGKYFSYKIGHVLVRCTPSLQAVIPVNGIYDAGISLPQKSYWRVRSVLGRVLGCLPDVKSLCGWIGPCPPVDRPHNQFISLKARRVAPRIRLAEDMFQREPARIDAPEKLQLNSEEDVEKYLRDAQDEFQWVMPSFPERDMTTYNLDQIRLKEVIGERLPHDTRSQDPYNQYRASLDFSMDDGGQVTYTLYANPQFITVPVCRPEKEVMHQVHAREVAKFMRNIVTVRDLKEFEPEGGDVLVINATGNGAECIARAWCAERGRDAIIAGKGRGTCYVCAYHAACGGDKGLDIGVLIWV